MIKPTPPTKQRYKPSLIDAMIMGSIVVIILILSYPLWFSSHRHKVMSWGHDQQVLLYANDGSVIGNWRSSGAVVNEENSNGFYFTDKVTDKLIRVEGTVVVKEL